MAEPTREIRTIIFVLRDADADTIAAAGRLKIGDDIALVREPDNPRDSAAIACYDADGQKIGYLLRQINQPVGARIGAGQSVVATIYSEARIVDGKIRETPKIKLVLEEIDG